MSLVLGVVLWLSARSAEVTHSRVDLDAACASCHAREAAQWAGSPHATAFTDAPFQRALLREPEPFCRGCHAPEQDARQTAVTDAAKLGVACVSCHLDPAAPVEVSGKHLRLAEVACAACHEFGFPDDGVRDHPLAMQSTVSEHRASPVADRPCAGCHMPPDTAGGHDHSISVSRDAEFLAKALTITAARSAADVIEVRLAVDGAGHAVPTGDLFRRLEVGAIAIDPTAPRAAARQWLGRTFTRRVETSGIEVIAELVDTRVFADAPRELRLVVPGAEGRAVVWWVGHQRVAFPRGRDPAAAVLDGETAIAGGVLAAAID